MKNKLLTLFLALAASVAPLFAQSGTCGTNLTWTLDTESGILTISGTGVMDSYTRANAPWYSYRSSIKTVIIEDGVTSIGTWAFYGCSSLTSVTIPNSVTSIGDDAFYQCSKLTSITIPNSVTTIEKYAFSNCISLTSITIPNSVTSIGNSAFWYCTSLTSITIPNSVTSIGNGAFEDCGSLTSILVDSENPNYCDIDGVLFNKNKTTLIQHPAGKSATSYIIPNSVTSIGDDAFSQCTSLTSVTIPNSVTSIGEYAFSDCSSLTSVTIPNSVTSIGDYAFYGCSSLPIIDGIRYADTYLVEAVDKTLSTYTIKEGTRWIGSQAFSGCSSLTSITIPNSVTSIGPHAFYGCTSLTSVTIPNSVTSIGWSAFAGCTGLTSVTIPNSVTSIGADAFSDTGIKSIVWNARNYNETPILGIEEQITQLTIEKNVETIPNFSFSNVHTIVWNAPACQKEQPLYHMKDKITSIEFGSEIESIPREFCSGFSRLESVTLTNKVHTIGYLAFQRLSTLNTIYYQGSLADWLNYDYSELTYVYGWGGGDIFINGEKLVNVLIPNEATHIRDGAFRSCRSIESVTLPEGLISIGGEAFRNTNLKAINFPSTLRSIGRYALVETPLESEPYSEWENGLCYHSNWIISSCGSNGFGVISPLIVRDGTIGIASGVFYCFAQPHYSGEKHITLHIPNSVQYIGANTNAGYFSWSQIDTLVFNANLDLLYRGAFSYWGGTVVVPCGTKESCIAKWGESMSTRVLEENTHIYNILPDNHGSILVTKEPDCEDMSIVFQANANDGFYFIQWSDGNTENPRTLQLTQDTTLVAMFDSGMDIDHPTNPGTYQLTLNASIADAGVLTGAGMYAQGTEVSVSATANTGYTFERWSDGVTDASRTITMIARDSTLTAIFSINRYTITFVDEDGTTVLASDEYEYGATPVYTGETPTKPADAQYTYTFAGWDKEVVAVTGDATYTAVFVSVFQCGTIETTDGITVWEDQLPYTWEGISFTTAGTETKTLQASDGCDSIVTFTLRVLYRNITLQENESSDYYTQFANDYNGQRVNTATLNRQFTQGKWATLCLPFNVNKAMMMSLGLYNRVFAFRYAQQLDDETIQVFFVPAQSIEAGKGYIVNPNAKLAAKTSFVFPNVTINTDSDNGDITALTGYNDGTGRGNLYLVGTLRTGILQGSTTGNTYLGLKDNQLYYPNSTSGTLMRAYRGFFRSDIPVNASRVRIIAEGESVTELEVTGDEQGRMDNGQLQNNATPAHKYLRNGILYIDRNGITYTAQGHRID